jgi:hypothetical protein
MSWAQGLLGASLLGMIITECRAGRRAGHGAGDRAGHRAGQGWVGCGVGAGCGAGNTYLGTQGLVWRAGHKLNGFGLGLCTETAREL